ncbi:transposase [Endozoicomonas sp. ONNA2]|uniref:transposase n=1 Tax=Endozoicomonas sp. ONNA2 TaxID=2828741 RepID=UPI0035A00A16
MFSWRWPYGFHCQKCGSSSFCKLHRKAEFQCTNMGDCPTAVAANWSKNPLLFGK